MFKWLRNKVMKGSKEEYLKGIDRNTNFLEFAKSFSNNSDILLQQILSIETENLLLWSLTYNDENMSKLLDIDMACRRLFANEYGGSDFNYNSKFNSK